MVKQVCVFSSDLFKRLNEAILGELEVLSGCFIGSQTLDNIRYADGTVLVAGIERKLEETLQKVVKKNEKKVLNINCKKIKWLSVEETLPKAN